MFFHKLTLIVANTLKPVLIRIVPIRFLRKVKQRLVSSIMDEIGSARPLPFDRQAYPDGINLIGPISSKTGLGQSCRLIAEAIKFSNIPFSIYDFVSIGSQHTDDTSWSESVRNTTPYNINLVHINPPDLAIAYTQLNKEIWDKRYNIAFWLWELETFPKAWLPTLQPFNEIWTPSEFISDCIRNITDKPVYTVPYPIQVPVNKSLDRHYFHLPENTFLFLCVYDCNSTAARKNPMGAIMAFKSAFSPEETNVGIVLKINHPQPEDLAEIRQTLSGYKNVTIIAGVLTKAEINALIACSNVYVSLHHAEGFGLVLAEAMSIGIPVIATNWSANTEFMNADIACMVNYTLVTLTSDIGCYEKESRWAEPDIQQAAQYMRKLYLEPEYTTALAKKAQAYIQDKLSLERASTLIIKRIAEIDEKKY